MENSSIAGTSLAFRADAGSRIGMGHVMRCLALAETWQSMGGCVTFVMATHAPGVKARLESEGMEVVLLSTQRGDADDAKQTAQVARAIGAQWVVVDGYCHGADYQRTIKDCDLRLLFVDDNGDADHYYADIVLNQNLHAHEQLYVCREPSTQLLLGTRYALLRHEFLKWRGWKREIPKIARRVLVTLGGGDSENATRTVIQALHRVDAPGMEVRIIVGASNLHTERLRHEMEARPSNLLLVRNVTDMSDLMVWADAAVSAGGSTCWEAAFMGLPSVVLVLADNQKEIADGLDKAGVVMNVGWHEEASPEDISEALQSLLHSPDQRREMCRLGRHLVDGEGSRRVAGKLRQESDSRISENAYSVLGQ